MIHPALPRREADALAALKASIEQATLESKAILAARRWGSPYVPPYSFHPEAALIRLGQVLILKHEVRAIRAELAAKFNPDQPRLPAGGPGGGRWTEGGSQEAFVRPRPQVRPAPRMPERPRPLVPPVIAPPSPPGSSPDPIDTYNRLADLNDPNRRPVLTLDSRVYDVDWDRESEGQPFGRIARVSTMTRDELPSVCPRAPEVQQRIDEAAADYQARFGAANEPPVLRGTRIHAGVAERINATFDPSLRAEVSTLKSTEASVPWDEKYRFFDPPSPAGTIRYDVFERAPQNTVCIYDLKTGRAPLTAARAEELALTARRFNGGAPPTRIIVTEMRPRLYSY